MRSNLILAQINTPFSGIRANLNVEAKEQDAGRVLTTGIYKASL